jgi:hypothetical protein
MRKILALVLVITTMLALAVPAMADPKKDAAPVDNFPFDVNNANFHCNDIEGENGRVWPDLTAFGVVDGKGNGGGNNKNKTSEKFNVIRVGSSTTWKLDDTVVCPSCGRPDWITFSNNSGTPNGNNVQFQHTGPTKRCITIQVFYHVIIPECEFPCVNAGLKCPIVCICGDECALEEDYPGHEPCTWKCNSVHECPFDADLTCSTVCGCAKNNSERIVNLKELIVIATGYLFEHDAPDSWNGGDYVSGPKSISKTLFNSARYDIDYEGEGDCDCDCDEVVCDVVCVLCEYTYTQPPGHVHIAICDNCKKGKGNNHGNCELRNPEGNTNYFCMDSGVKIGSLNANHGWTLRHGWTPADERPYCECSTCYPKP